MLPSFLLALALQTPPMPQADDAAIRALWERATRALCAGDWDGYRRLWAHREYIEVIHPDQADWRVGWEQIGPAYRELLASGFRCDARTHSMRIRVAPSGEMAWATAEMLLRPAGPEGGERIVWQTLVFEKIEGEWRLVHGHASVPREPG